MVLKNFSRNDQIIGPRSLMVNGVPLGYIAEDGISWKPAWTTEPVTTDQRFGSIGHNMTGIGGTLDIKVWDITADNYAALRGIPTGVAITSPMTGIAFNELPTVKLPDYTLVWWGLGASGAIIMHAVKGNLVKPPQMDEGRKKATVMDLSFELNEFSSGYPGGYTAILTAVSGSALSFTSVPAGAATGVALAAAPTLTFNRAMPMTALFAEHWTFVKHVDSSAVLYTPSFGTITVNGVTLPDPTKIVLTPDALLTGSAVYDITPSPALFACDGNALGANGVLFSFTCASS